MSATPVNPVPSIIDEWAESNSNPQFIFLFCQSSYQLEKHIGNKIFLYLLQDVHKSYMLPNIMTALLLILMQIYLTYVLGHLLVLKTPNPVKAI
jgi:hypothetical protein